MAQIPASSIGRVEDKKTNVPGGGRKNMNYVRARGRVKNPRASKNIGRERERERETVAYSWRLFPPISRLAFFLTFLREKRRVRTVHPVSATVRFLFPRSPRELVFFSLFTYPCTKLPQTFSRTSWKKIIAVPAFSPTIADNPTVGGTRLKKSRSFDRCL